MSKDLAELPTLTITYRGLCNFLLSDNNLQAYGDSDDSVVCGTRTRWMSSLTTRGIRYVKCLR